MIGEEETTLLRIDIREVIFGFSFPELHMPNPKTVDIYMDELKARVYIMTFTYLNTREPSDTEVR